MSSGDDRCTCQQTVIKCTSAKPPDTIRKLVELMENPHSKNHVDRQTELLDEYLASCPFSFWVTDLTEIMRVMELLKESLETFPIYRKYLSLIIKVCGAPPMFTKTSDVLTFRKDLEQFIDLLGYFLVYFTSKEDDIKFEILAAIMSLLQRKTPAGICCVTLKTCNEIVESSQLPDIITDLLDLIDDDFYIRILDLILILIEISDIICLRMMSKNILDTLMVRLDTKWKTRAFTFDFIDFGDFTPQNIDYFYKIVWKLLNALKADTDKVEEVPTPKLEAVWSLQQSFRFYTVQKREEINRNVLMAVILSVLELFPDVEIIRLGVAEDICTISVATEVGTAGTWASLNYFTNTDLDYSLKKMCLLGLRYVMRQSYSGSHIIQKHRVIHGLLRLITPGLSIDWHPQSQYKLIVLALNALKYIIPELPTEFLSNNGPVRLLMLIEYYNIEPYDSNILKSCLQTLYETLKIQKIDVAETLRICNTINILVNLSNNLLKANILTLTQQRCLGHIFSVLQKLYKNTEIESIPTVDLCLTYMKRILQPKPEDPTNDPKVVICAMDLIWEAIVWNETNLKEFIRKGGVYSMLDIIESFKFAVKLVALGALVDLCEEGSCIPHVITWRKNGKKITTVLLEIFRNENLKLGVMIKPRGIVADTELPLMGEQQWYETYSEEKSPDSSPAIMDLLASCRPKIYAILQLINYRHKERVAIANEHYNLYNDELDCDDQITLLLVENFLALKLGETWVELEMDLQNAGIRPLAIDREIINTLTRRYYKWSLHIRKVQENLIREERRTHEINERLLYNLLKESRLQRSLYALQELTYIARTTENNFRHRYKMLQRRAIENSLEFDVESESQHRTYMDSPDVTPIFGHVISVQSNQIIDPNEKKFDIRPVSPENDEENIPFPNNMYND